ncbi:MAG: phosphoribosylamine--glycine ligase [candidate division Zixibacteria bacterium]|nr:phosphoribosylamine--glycine ligase [candidate division Zixibacteria bacterium]
MKILVIGGGGREHALCWALRSSPQVEKVYCAPGNAGIAEIARQLEIKPTDTKKLIEFARHEAIDLTVVGPEDPIVGGVVDTFRREKLRVFGPTAAAAQLEGSKAFAKSFMRRHNIPTAPFAVFDNAEEATRFCRESEGPLVVKADGLAAGKGVIVCETPAEAEAAVQHIMVERAFGAVGEKIVIERRLAGQELSVMAFADGRHVALMLPARDYKRALDGDRGANTGGMGAYAPAIRLDDPLLEEIERGIIQKTIDGMAEDGIPYSGVLYAGLMMTESGPKVLEFNCRFGDPETQVVLPLLKTDLVDVIGAALAGKLDMEPLEWRDEVCACVILTSKGYPGKYETGAPISGTLKTESDGLLRFHAGTSAGTGGVITAGGRVLGICSRSSTHEGAIASAYAGVERVQFKGAQFRTDIGLRPAEVHRMRRAPAERRGRF